jgi:hypothetical protein
MKYSSIKGRQGRPMNLKIAISHREKILSQANFGLFQALEKMFHFVQSTSL